MRTPGLLARTILASVLVAAVAVVATAILTMTATRASYDRQQVQRQNLDHVLVDRVLAYGRTHAAWSGAGQLLKQLSTGGRELALTDVHGETLASTGRAAVDGADPTAVLDPLPGLLISVTAHVPRSYRTLGLPTALLAGTHAGTALSDRASTTTSLYVCGSGNADLTPYLPGGLATTVIEMNHGCHGVIRSVTVTGSSATQAIARLNNTIVLQENQCLVRRGVDTALVRLDALDSHEPALLTVFVPAGGPSAEAAVPDAWRDCSTAALTRNLTPRVAPSALLYVTRTTSVTRGVLDRIGRIRTVGALLVVLLAVLVASLLASRRVLRPVGQLTAATQQMARGELSVRVPVDGRDQVAALARSFNEMAGSLATAEEQRRRMVSDIAHELRTPLSNIRGYLEAGQDGVLERDDAWTASLLEETTLLQHVVDDLQVLAEADAGRLVVRTDATDLTATVDLAIQGLTGYAGARDVRLERIGDAGDVHHDPLRMRQVVANLLSNAIRYSPAGSSVTVELTRGEAVGIEVRDSGPGIAPEHLEHVFERFYRADQSRSRDTGGSGLGLAIVEQLVRAHGGTVTASNGETGAVMLVTLPRA